MYLIVLCHKFSFFQQFVKNVCRKLKDTLKPNVIAISLIKVLKYYICFDIFIILKDLTRLGQMSIFWDKNQSLLGSLICEREHTRKVGDHKLKIVFHDCCP